MLRKSGVNVIGLPVQSAGLGPAVGLHQKGLWWTGAADAAVDRSQGNHSVGARCYKHFRYFSFSYVLLPERLEYNFEGL